jgi:hypothetical protein
MIMWQHLRKRRACLNRCGASVNVKSWRFTQLLLQEVLVPNGGIRQNEGYCVGALGCPVGLVGVLQGATRALLGNSGRAKGVGAQHSQSPPGHPRAPQGTPGRSRVHPGPVDPR